MTFVKDEILLLEFQLETVCACTRNSSFTVDAWNSFLIYMAYLLLVVYIPYGLPLKHIQTNFEDNAAVLTLETSQSSIITVLILIMFSWHNSYASFILHY